MIKTHSTSPRKFSMVGGIFSEVWGYFPAGGAASTPRRPRWVPEKKHGEKVNRKLKYDSMGYAIGFRWLVTSKYVYIGNIKFNRFYHVFDDFVMFFRWVDEISRPAFVNLTPPGWEREIHKSSKLQKKSSNHREFSRTRRMCFYHH